MPRLRLDRALRQAPSPCSASPISSRTIGSSMVAGIDHASPSAIFFMVPRRILPERVLGRRATVMASLKAATGPILSRTRADEFRLDLVRRPVDAGFQHHEAAGHLALERILHADHGAFRDRRMGGQHLLHAAGRETVAGDVDDVVGAAHDVDIAVLVDDSRHPRCCSSRDRPRGRLPGSARPPARGSAAHPGGSGSLMTMAPMVSGGDRLAAFVQHLEGIARHRHRGRAVLDRERSEPERVAGDRPAGLRLPPMVDDRHLRGCPRPIAPYRDRRARRRGTGRGTTERSYVFRSSAFGSSFLMARKAVGAVNSVTTPCSAITRQKAPASGVPTGLPS